MPALSWNEIRQRAIQFSRDWKSASSERAEAQTFWNSFFEVFGIKRRVVAAFEEPVRNLTGNYDRIDLLWSGRFLAEHKSAGENLEKAESQAFSYIQELVSSGRTDEVPRYIALSNFTHMALFDLEPEVQQELPLREGQPYEKIVFPLSELHRYVRHFAFFIGQTTHKFREEDPANLKAAQLMADLHDAVTEGGYEGTDCERLLVRILFCLFAEDTGIFDAAQFLDYIHNHTNRDGSDLGPQLNALFDVLNTPENKRSKHIDEDLTAFPYVNGDLFADHLPLAGFSRQMSTQLRTCCSFDWSRISPAIFGSLFQGILDKAERRQIGAHYTTEHNILKVIKPLFLDALYDEFEPIRRDRSNRRTARLRGLQKKLAGLRFLDPACGCGNFLVIAYRELRRLELKILNELYEFEKREKELDLGELAKLSIVDVNQFYGIEIGEWPARIAETALWLTDHQMNVELSVAAGNLFQRIPLKASPHICCANALRMDWNELLPKEECSYVFGNPPFVGAKFQSDDQRSDVKHIAGGLKNSGLLDYVSLWYLLATDYVDGTKAAGAFVSSNSICQGEQVGVLWSELFRRGVKINFAHRTFAWQSEARGKAHVHVVIVGFGKESLDGKTIFDYEHIKGEPIALEVGFVNRYLVEAPDIALTNRSNPICDAPTIGIGNKPIDGGYYLFTPEEKAMFLEKEPDAEHLFRRWIGAREFLHGIERWCLFLVDVSPQKIRSLPLVKERVEMVSRYRLGEIPAKGKDDTAKNKKRNILTQKLAATPTKYHVENLPSSNYLVIPKTSSERRFYIPIGHMTPSTICGDAVHLVNGTGKYHFGVLTSAMHMAWVRQVCGRLKSDFRYSIKLVYNNYPWPVDATDKQKDTVATMSQKLLDIRQKYLDGGATLADLYDPLVMPRPLLKAHQALDKAVDRCYRPKKFDSERERIEFLFDLYEQLTAPLLPTTPKKPRKRRVMRKKPKSKTRSSRQ
ncbi:MAG: class I SAM-dependent DNA methyltransferase [candidate division Zixibacteria bacterium]|nr:class I SAM-dependent DNA methyltransferase [candidate division Zixibacteria bacterium]